MINPVRSEIREAHMALYIRDRETEELVVELQGLIKAKNKTETVRQALKNELELVSAEISRREFLEQFPEADLK